MSGGGEGLVKWRWCGFDGVAVGGEWMPLFIVLVCFRAPNCRFNFHTAPYRRGAAT